MPPNYCLRNEPALGLDDYNQLPLSKNSLILYPNPSTESFQISGLEPEVLLGIFNLSGKNIKSIPSYKSEKVEVFNWVRGIYLVKVNLAHIQQAFKLHSKLILILY